MTTKIRVATLAMFVVAAMTIVSARDLAGPAGQGRQGQVRPNRTPGQPQNPNPQGDQKQPPVPDQLSPAYIQQLLDALAVVEAERFLPLSAEQYPPFVQKLKKVQEVRMQLNRRRQKAFNELRGLAGPQAQPDVPDNLIDAKLKELTLIEQDGQAAMRKALDDLDAGLSVRQRARYRLLEEQMERRKVDFLTKVRGGGRGLEGIPR